VVVGERQALLAAIHAAPDDDLPRLVFADWLDEQGEPIRAEFVRLQIERARCDTRPGWTDRLVELLGDPAALLDPIDRDAFERVRYHPLFERGFLCGVMFPDFHPELFDPPIYPAEEVADDWHRLCDLVAAPAVRRAGGRRSPAVGSGAPPDAPGVQRRPARGHFHRDVGDPG
jgi:uncharacterized protein (TIGR02996 family)